MSSGIDQLQEGQVADGTAEDSMTDWLKRLEFRKTAPAGVVASARRGIAEEFLRELRRNWGTWCRIGKKSRDRLIHSLSEIWSETAEGPVSVMDSASLAHCLFETDLSRDELSGRVETIMAGFAGRVPDLPTLSAACWLLRLSWNRLEPQTLVSLWRWTCEAGQQILGSQSSTEKPDWDQLEAAIIYGQLFDWLKGCRKQANESRRALQQRIDETTDDDGSPHARDLEDCAARLCQFGRLKLFLESFAEKPWKLKLQRRIEGLYNRTASLWTPARMCFSGQDAVSIAKKMKGASEALTGGASLEFRSGRSRSRLSIPLLPVSTRTGKSKPPRECHESDWSGWGALRSGWSAPVDACVIRFAGPVPELELIAADVPVLAGAWSHELHIDGQEIPAIGEWTCCCWYTDRQAAYMELQLSHEKAQVIRQALLLREESVLLIGDSVRAVDGSRIDFRRSIPVCGHWEPEQDSATRELALVQSESRVRVFPLSAPQIRLDGCQEATTFQGESMVTTAASGGTGLFVATLLDWSARRKEEAVDWQRLTVAEDGEMLPPQTAAGYRLRIGKKQWLLYHSLRKGNVPRTVMGLHSSSETVFARLDSDGDLQPLVEVEL